MLLKLKNAKKIGSSLKYSPYGHVKEKQLHAFRVLKSALFLLSDSTENGRNTRAWCLNIKETSTRKKKREKFSKLGKNITENGKSKKIEKILKKQSKGRSKVSQLVTTKRLRH